MARIGSLAATLTLNANKFHAELGKAVRGTESINQRMKAVGLAAKTWMAGVAVQALGQFNSKIDESFKRITELHDHVKLLGVDLETFQGLEFAAESAGVDPQQFRNATRIFRRRLGQGDDPELARGLGMLGLDPRMLKSVGDLEKQLLLVSQALSRVGDAQERVTIAQKLFDSDNVRLLNFLSQGASKIVADAQMVEDFAVTQEQADQADSIRRQSVRLERQRKQAEEKWGLWLKGIQVDAMQIGGNLIGLNTLPVQSAKLGDTQRALGRFAGIDEIAQHNLRMEALAREYYAPQRALEQRQARRQQAGELLRRQTVATEQMRDALMQREHMVQPARPADDRWLEQLTVSDAN